MEALDTESVVTLNEAAGILGVTRYQLRYILTSGKASDVRQFAGRRVFSANDLQRLKGVVEDVYGLTKDRACAQRGVGVSG